MKKIILSSKSPRRQQLLADMGIEFDVKTIEVEEVYPDDLPSKDVASYLAELKAEPFRNQLDDSTIVITSDTVVVLKDMVLGKPKDRAQAIEMLNRLSGNTHEVITGVCLLSKGKKRCFSSSTKVYFKHLTASEIEYYVDNYNPFDKAGSYGIQEWIGYIGIEKIEGSYFNVMGLPVHELYKELNEF